MKISTRLFLVMTAAYLIVAAAVVAMIRYEMRQQAFLEAESKANLWLELNLDTLMSSIYVIREVDKYFQDLSPLSLSDDLPNIK